MPKPLRVLMIEDSEDDAELILLHLKKNGYEPECTRIETSDEMQEALQSSTWDIIFSDYNLPRFNGLLALGLLRSKQIDTPFILISGAVGEETAVTAMRAGANDYLMKDKLARLVPVIERELREVDVRQAKYKAEQELHLTARVFESSMEAMAITDSESKILRVNKAFTDITGFKEHEIVGKTPEVLHSGRHNSDFFHDMWLSLGSNGYWCGEIWNRRKNGEVYPGWLTISAVHNSEGEVTHYISGATDLSAQKESEQRIQHLMYYDALTELPNRTLFRERFKKVMTRAQHEKKRVAFFHVDMDRFIAVNDTFGHRTGDRILKQVGSRLQASIKEHDIVARFTGDEFAIAMPDLAEQECVEDLTKRLISAFSEPFNAFGNELFLTPNVGVSVFPDDSEHYDELVCFADTALHKIKRRGGGGYQLYEKAMNSDAADRMNTENALRRALERNEFIIYYQPQISMKTGNIIGLEALLRWQRPDMKLVPPNLFIPLLEENGLIVPVGEWVLKQACSDHLGWVKAGYNPGRIAVNLSALQFRNRNLVSTIKSVLNKVGCSPEILELEITESSVMDDPEFALETLNVCHDMGVRLAIDDFGTGYSSLSYLKRFPLDVLKIDQSFVSDIPEDEDDAAIIDTIIAMAHRLKLDVIAEGVENAAQAEFLREHGCDHVQGYYYGRPMPAVDIPACLVSKNV